MNKENKKKIIKSVIYPLVLATAISGLSNLKKDSRYNSSNYSSSIIEEISLKGNLDSYVLQGGCTDGTYKFLTAYDNNGKNNSIIITLNDKNIIINKVTLGTKCHAGGITYDYDHNLIWITDINGTVTAYNKQSILEYGIDESKNYNENYKEPLTPKYNQIYLAGEDMKTDLGKPTISCITYSEGKLYAANYSKTNNSKLKICNVKENGEIDNINVKTIDFINYVQGIYLVEIEETTYLIVSTSNGLANDSILKFYKYSESITDYKKENYKFYKMPPMSEGIFIDKDSNINITNESNAKKYNFYANFFYNDAEDITVLDSNNMLKKFKYWK